MKITPFTRQEMIDCIEGRPVRRPALAIGTWIHPDLLSEDKQQRYARLMEEYPCDMEAFYIKNRLPSDNPETDSAGATSKTPIPTSAGPDPLEWMKKMPSPGKSTIRYPRTSRTPPVWTSLKAGPGRRPLPHGLALLRPLEPHLGIPGHDKLPHGSLYRPRTGQTHQRPHHALVQGSH